MKIELKRKINVKKFKAILDIGEKTERSDIIAVLKIAQDHRGKVSEQIICKEFIFRDHIQMAKRVLRRCVDFKVLNEDYTISEDGQKALIDGEVFQPLTGTYTVWATNDPLLPQKILNIEPFDERINFKEEVKTKDKQGLSEKMEDLPDWLKDFSKLKEIQLFDVEKKEIRIQNIDEKIQPLLETKELIAKLVFSEKPPILTLSGLFEIDRNFPLDIEIDSILEELLEDRQKNWDRKKKAYKIDFSELSSTEKQTFKTTLQFSNPNLAPFGIFDPFKLENVKIVPKMKQDANLWANWLLGQNIGEYIFESNFEEYQNQIAEKFPDYEITFLDRIELLNEIKNAMNRDEFPPEFWFLQAPLDLIVSESKEEE